MKNIQLIHFFRGKILLFEVLALMVLLFFSYQYYLKLLASADTGSYTELYFTNLQSIPESVYKQKKITLHFAIHNVEKSDMMYSCQIVLSKNGKNQVIDTEKIPVKKNQIKTITENIPIYSGDHYKSVTVYLINKHQEIHLYFPDTT